MSITNRIFLCGGIFLLDLLLFFLPLTAMFLAYILLFNPPWFRDFLDTLDQPVARNGDCIALCQSLVENHCSAVRRYRKIRMKFFLFVV